MKQKLKPSAVAGVVATAPRPTPLGAAIVAAVITLPIGLILLIADLVFF